MTAATLALGPNGSSEPAAEDSLKYQLTVLAPSVLAAVSQSGGWLFDRVMSGWDVTVLIPNPGDIRPLEILGARGVDLEAAVEAARKKRRPHALAVVADLFDAEDRVSTMVRTALSRGASEVTFWGLDVPGQLDRPMSIAEHPLTAAARAFKGQALAAAAAHTGAVADTERYFTGASVGSVTHV